MSTQRDKNEDKKNNVETIEHYIIGISLIRENNWRRNIWESQTRKAYPYRPKCGYQNFSQG